MLKLLILENNNNRGKSILILINGLKNKKQDEAEADGGGLRVPEAVLRDADGGEQTAAKGARRAPGAEDCIQPFLHAPARHHPLHVPFLRAHDLLLRCLPSLAVRLLFLQTSLPPSRRRALDGVAPPALGHLMNRRTRWRVRLL